MAEQNQTPALEEQLLSREIVYKGVIVQLEHWQVTLPNGKTALREVAVHPGASAVVALDDEDNIILVRQQRIAVDRVTTEIPAGKFDHVGEDPLECAQRELSEETGLTADSWEKLTVLETTVGFCNERIHMFLARGLHAGADHPDEDEFVAVEKRPLREMVELAMRGEIRDAKTLTGILMAARAIAPASI